MSAGMILQLELSRTIVQFILYDLKCFKKNNLDEVTLMSLGLSPRLHNKSVHLNGKPVLQVSGLENLGSESLIGKVIEYHYGNCRTKCFWSSTHTRDWRSGNLGLCCSVFFF